MWVLGLSLAVKQKEKKIKFLWEIFVIFYLLQMKNKTNNLKFTDGFGKIRLTENDVNDLSLRIIKATIFKNQMQENNFDQKRTNLG